MELIDIEDVDLRNSIHDVEIISDFENNGFFLTTREQKTPGSQVYSILIWKYNYISKIWTDLQPIDVISKVLGKYAVLQMDCNRLLFFNENILAHENVELFLYDVVKQSVTKLVVEGISSNISHRLNFATGRLGNQVFLTSINEFEEFTVHMVDFIDYPKLIWKDISAYDNQPPIMKGVYEMTIYNSKMYIFGSRVSERAERICDIVCCYDIDEQKWIHYKTYPDNVNGYPSKIFYNSPIVRDQKAYLISKSMSDFHVWRLDLLSFQWELLILHAPTLSNFSTKLQLTTDGHLIIFDLYNILMSKKPLVLRLWLPFVPSTLLDWCLKAIAKSLNPSARIQPSGMCNEEHLNCLCFYRPFVNRYLW